MNRIFRKYDVLNPAYILLSVLSVGLSTLTSLMIIKFFGATASADVYLMSVAIVSTLQLIQLLMVDQFMYFYLERKREGRRQAQSFFSVVFIQSLAAGTLFSVLCYISSELILMLFASGLEEERKEYLSQIFGVLVWSCSVFSANFVVHRLLNAEGRFAYPYWLEMIVPFSCLMMFCFFFISGIDSLLLLAFARLAGLILSFFLGIVTLFRLGYFARLEWNSTVGFACYRNSFSMRFGHNLHNFLFSPITNSFLSTLPVGAAAIYYYAERFVQLVNVVISGPLQRVYQVRVSVAWLEKPSDSIYSLMKSYCLIAVPLFTIVSTVLYFLMPYIFRFDIFASLSTTDIGTLQLLFALLAAWVGLVAAEHTFVAVGLVAKKSWIFITVNLLFIFCYTALCYGLRGEYGLLAIPVSAFSAQLVSFTIFSAFVVKLIRGRDKASHSLLRSESLNES